MSQRTIAFIIPWFSPEIGGGAETECKRLARYLHGSGCRVEILTTCIKNFRSDWNVNHYSSGVQEWNGVKIRRFPVKAIDRERFHQINRLLMDGQKTLSQKDESIFCNGIVHSDELTAYAQQNSSAYVFIPIPYMFGTTIDIAKACPRECVLLPCLHDESYAYLNCYKSSFADIAGAFVHVPSEKQLFERLYGHDRVTVVGEGVEPVLNGDAQRFYAKYSDKKFILYVGRKDEGKGVYQLLEYFQIFKKHTKIDLGLYLIGPGILDINTGCVNFSDDIVDLGFVSEQDKRDAFAAASALCNPSAFESFSLVLMEAWQQKTPVLVNAECAVTFDHCRFSNGGLYYKNVAEFTGCLQYLLENPDSARQMGINGEHYVQQNYSYSRVINQFLVALKELGFQVLANSEHASL